MNKLSIIITPLSAELSLPTLDKLIKKAAFHPVTGIFRYFSPPLAQSLPIGALSGLGQNVDTHEGYWLRADPVDLRTDINTAYFFGQQSLGLDLPAAKEIGELIKPLLLESGIELFIPDPYCWYLKLPRETSINSPHPSTMLGASIRDYLIEAEPEIRRLFVEIQMLLAGVPKPQKMEQRPVTGLWLWGGGVLPSLLEFPYNMIYSNDIVGKGLALASHIPLSTPNDFMSNMDYTGNNLLIIHPENDLDERYLFPIYQALKKKRISELSVYLGGEKVYYITAKKVHPWWKLV